MIGIDSEKSQQPEIVNISIGTLFSYIREGVLTDKIGVVMDFGGSITFQGTILHEKEGKKYIGGGIGTMGGDEFGARLGQMSLSDLIEAVRLGKELMHITMTQEDIAYINEQFSKGSIEMQLVNRYYPRPKELINNSNFRINHPV